ncbi:hypothetical protein NOR53_504 [gamma proteobacterium NOR5-3]|nr:hypothetical protein NOR53_504 [gamma proteobacterium NOR5-3]
MQITFEQVTPTSVKVAAVGSLDIPGPPATGSPTLSPTIDYASPTKYTYVVGALTTSQQVDSYQLPFTTEEFFQRDPAASQPALSSDGAPFGFANIFTFGTLYVPQGYSSGGVIFGSSTFPGTLGDLNLIAGDFDFVYGAGGGSRTITVVVPGNSVGGTVTGLTGSLRLQNNGTDDLIVSRSLNPNVPFSFPTKLVVGDAYAVTVATQPVGQFCSVTNGGSGTMASSDITSVQINCVAGNTAPVAQNDTYSTSQDTTLIVPVSQGLLVNDGDAERDPLTLTKVDDPTGGTVTALDNDGSFTYVPNPGFFGTDSFTYQLNDGALNSNKATVQITVNEVNQAPVANDDSYSTPQDTDLFVVISQNSVLSNDLDPDGDTLTPAKVSDPANGTLSADISGAGFFIYTPNSGFFGTDSFTYRVNDGALNSNVATVTITVNPANRAPIAGDDNYSTSEDTTLSVPVFQGLLLNDGDPDGDITTVATVSNPTRGTLSSLNDDGSFTYVPNPGTSGPDSFTYQLSDGALDSNVATVNITVNAVNDAPVANNDSYTMTQGSFLALLPDKGTLANDSDPDGDILTMPVTNQPMNGHLSPAANGSFIYTPDPTFSGVDSFTYLATDGSLLSNTATVQITVNRINLPPVANNDVYATPQDTPLTVADAGVLGNDIDPEGNALRISTIETQPANGQLSPSLQGGFTYTPNAGFSGTDSFSYRASDNQLDSNLATVQIAVNAVNRPPIAGDDSYSTSRDTTLTVPGFQGLLLNDADPDGDTLTVVKVSDPANGTLIALNDDGSFIYVPDPNFSGPDSFTYQLNDGPPGLGLGSNFATVNITVNAVNRAPVANNDSYSMTQGSFLALLPDKGTLANDSDPDGDILTMPVTNQPMNGHLSPAANGSFIYTPDPTFSGVDSFTYQATDGSLLSNAATVQITVNAINLPPVANGDVYATPQDTPLTVPTPGILGNDADPEGNALQLANIVTQPANGQLSPSSLAGGFTYTPNAGFNGRDSFFYQASDGQLNSNIANVQITVTPSSANLPPVANGDIYSTPRDTVLNVAALAGVLSNDSDPEGHALTVTVTRRPMNGILTANPDGSFSYRPNVGFSGTDNFAYRDSDGADNSNIATVQITVTAANLPPVANGDLFAIPQGTVLNVAAPGVLANDADPEGHALTVTVTSQPMNGTLAKNPNGGFSYTPDAGFSGTDSYRYTANDGALDSNEATVQITVTAAAANLPPVANGDAYTTPQDTLLPVPAPGVLANDSDPEGHALTVTVTSQPANGALAKNPNGSFSYVPNAGFIGTDTYTYTVSDGPLTSNQTSVSITVTRAAASQAVPVPALGWPALPLLMFMTVVVGAYSAQSRVRS